MTMDYPFCLPISLPKQYHVHNFTDHCKNGQCGEHTFSIGRYNESRDFYTANTFQNRTIHLGIDFGAPAGTPILSVSDCTVYYCSIFNTPGDYGGLLVTENKFDSHTLYCVYGHVSHASLRKLNEGDRISKNEYLCAIGDTEENGSWPPHLHFQVSTIRPQHGENIPGVFSDKDIQHALSIYPDPQLYFGSLYL